MCGPTPQNATGFFLSARESNVIIHHDDVSSRIVYRTTFRSTLVGYAVGAGAIYEDTAGRWVAEDSLEQMALPGSVPRGDQREGWGDS